MATVIDPTTNLGKVRLRIGDWSDPVILPDVVILSALSDAADDVLKASVTCAYYVLGVLAQGAHMKMTHLEIWGKEKFDSYVKFVNMVIESPSSASFAPVIYSSQAEYERMSQFVSDWNKTYSSGTESQSLAWNAAISPNDGSLYGRWGGEYYE